MGHLFEVIIRIDRIDSFKLVMRIGADLIVSTIKSRFQQAGDVMALQQRKQRSIEHGVLCSHIENENRQFISQHLGSLSVTERRPRFFRKETSAVKLFPGKLM